MVPLSLWTHCCLHSPNGHSFFFSIRIITIVSQPGFWFLPSPTLNGLFLRSKPGRMLRHVSRVSPLLRILQRLPVSLRTKTTVLATCYRPGRDPGLCPVADLTSSYHHAPSVVRRDGLLAGPGHDKHVPLSGPLCLFHCLQFSSLFLVFFFFFLRAAPTAHGSSQARG